jgi:uncharacterized protein YjiS (DUF1127 family)
MTTAHSLGLLPEALRGAALMALGRAAKLLEARRNRRAIMRLAACDDRMLKDIGLSRSQVLGALAVRYQEDPSLLLQRWRWRRPLPDAGRPSQPR